MFSSTMMASSTTIPIPSDSASRVNVLSVKPKKYRHVNVPTIAVGMAMRMFSVALQEPRNTQQTNEVRMADKSSVKVSSLTESSTKRVRLKLTPRSMPGGRSFLTSSIRARSEEHKPELQ